MRRLNLLLGTGLLLLLVVACWSRAADAFENTTQTSAGDPLQLSTPLANPSWEHLSSATGDLPAPGPAVQQTASLILDIDGDGLGEQRGRLYVH